MKKLLLFICSIFFTMNLMSQVTILSQTNVSCPGMCNGAVTLSITGGSMPYTVSNFGFSTSCTFPPYPPMFSNTITISGLCACAYSLQVKDGTNALIGTAPATITAPPAIVNTFSVQNVCCNGSCNGAIYSFVTGGTPGYSYTWTPVGPSGPNYTAACAGNYTLSIKDSKGCPKTFTSQVTQPPVFSVASLTAATTCSSCCNGSINVIATGGSPGYTYTIYPSVVTNTTGAFTNLCAGGYSICASDAGCCSFCTGVVVPSGSVSAINNLSSQPISIEVYPNPSDGNIKIVSAQNLLQMNYEVFDIIGNKIDSGKATDAINISQVSDGIYILVIKKSDGGITARKKINIKH